MVWKGLTLINLIWCVCAVTARPSQPSHAISEQKFIKYFNKAEEKIISRTGSEGAGDHEEYVDTYPSYEFSYKIIDPDTHDIKGQQEKRHGDKVNGDYWLVEPDGRKRVVKYHASDKIGFKVLIDYLKKEGFHVTPNKEQKKLKEVEEKKIEESSLVEPEPEPEPESEKNQSEENRAQEEVKTSESQGKESLKSESGEPKEEEKQNGKKENEQKARDESKSVSAVRITKVIRPRLLIRIINEDDDVENNQKERPSESNIVRQRNSHIRKDWSMKKEKPKDRKQEINKNNSDEGNKEVVNLREKIKFPYHYGRKKGYEVEEKVIENDTDVINVEKQQNRTEVETVVTTEKGTKIKLESSDKEKHEKNNNSEDEERNEEVYGYNTFIYHAHQ